MSKWIEYQPVIDEIKHEWCNKCNKTCPYNNCKIYRVMQILRRQKPIPHETKRPQGEWIPVSERLPEKIGTYLVTLEYKEHGKGITTLWFHGKDIGWDLRVADVVTAWQPLPEPYQKGGAE